MIEPPHEGRLGVRRRWEDRGYDLDRPDFADEHIREVLAAGAGAVAHIHGIAAARWRGLHHAMIGLDVFPYRVGPVGQTGKAVIAIAIGAGRWLATVQYA